MYVLITLLREARSGKEPASGVQGVVGICRSAASATPASHPYPNAGFSHLPPEEFRLWCSEDVGGCALSIPSGARRLLHLLPSLPPDSGHFEYADNR